MTSERFEDQEFGSQHVSRLLSMPYYLGGIISGIVLFLLFLIIAELSYLLVIPPHRNAVFWLPSGLSAMAFIRARWYPRIWPFWIVALFLGEFCIVTSHDIPLVTAIFWASTNISLPL